MSVLETHIFIYPKWYCHCIINKSDNSSARHEGMTSWKCLGVAVGKTWPGTGKGKNQQVDSGL